MSGNADFLQPQGRLTGQDEFDLKKWISIVLQHRALGLIVAAIVVMLGGIYLFMAQPVFQTDALIQIAQQQPTLLSLASPQQALLEEHTDGQTEIEIIRSRSVLGRAVEDLHLEINAAPRRFPIFGAALSRRGLGGAFRYLGGRYAWGNERIDIDQFDVPPSLVGTGFILRAEKNRQYLLVDHGGKVLLEGEVGKTSTVPVASGVMTLLVREMEAGPGVEFLVSRSRPEDAVAALQLSLDVALKNKQNSLVQLVMSGADPAKITTVLNGVIRAYIQQNVDQHSEQASKSLEFLNQQLPEIRQQLAAAEGALESYKSRKGSVIDVSEEGKSILGQATALDTKVSELKLRRSELKLRFTDASPPIQAIDKQLAQLVVSGNEIDEKMRKMPQKELETIRLMRDAKVTNELYVQLLNKAQEFKVTKAGTVGDARIVDVAIQPVFPAFPKTAKILVMTLLLAIAAGLGAIIARVVLQHTMDTPEVIEAELGLPVFATIPHSESERKAYRDQERGHAPQLLCRMSPDDQAVEGLRSLRTSLQFASLEAKNNIVAIHGPTPGIGKSFVAANLAFLISDTDKKTLLVDADMRKGHIHKTFALEQSPGLSEIISGTVSLENAGHALEDGKLTFVSTGKFPPNPSELLAHGRFGELLQQVSKSYDFVILDLPPTLNLADSISIGKQAGVNFLVVRAGVSTIHDVRIAQQRLQQNGIRIDGVIFNGLSTRTAAYGYGGYYAYKYKQGSA